MAEARVAAVVVTYRPDPDELRSLLFAVAPQVAELVIVHNGAEPPDLPPLPVRPQVVVLGDNLGVARAQNEGIEHALSRYATHVLLLDQDSEPAPDMVARLLAAEAELTLAGHDVAALGPRYLDVRQENPPPFIRIRGLRLERQRCERADAVVPVDYLVSSGCLIPGSSIARVGEMDEALFIDYIDIEWGLRAAAAGLQCYGVCAARMAHALGERPLRILGRPRPLHSALRHYYLFRNAVWLYRRPDLPWRWKWVDGWRLLLKFGAYALFARPRVQHWHMMGKGIWHGLRGRLGRYPSDA